MNDDCEPDDAVGTIKVEVGVEAVVRGLPGGVGRDVAKVADVPLSGLGCAVGFAFGIVVTAR